MPYSPTTWADAPATSSPISAANLNKIETELARLKVNADLDPAAAIAYSKLALALSIVNGDISTSAAIAYSKLNLASSIVNADVANAAAIAISKIAVGGTVGQVVKGDGSVALAGTYRKTTSKAVNTTVAATDLLNGEITVAAGVMGTTGGLRLTAWGDWINNSASTVASPRFQAVFGGTTLLDTGISGTGVTDVKRNSWRIVVEILNLGAANSQMSHMDLRLMVDGALTQVDNAFTTGEGIMTSITASGQVVFGEGVNPSTAVDTSLAKALVLNVINGSASASYETKLLGALVEVI